ncbi:MAG: carboxymuconolactone decarboxylase family protein [Gammaproteobacteria bacterium]|nr:carboxymuconolactone decarboxylase family protein [Gammaproteobacteria bacterium]MBU1440683.1 carboxymuconolactone decarboxylase family protein [Gammaproteobacteria bacterium]MBU2288737.1 carboxymuconolactone decarboxylase family protein [Gammaproteobacteria bacterium]MBU2408073.1 carboxymuconolactone decarboxylase family protein [Gammaproteobacteria bacterium]
MTSPRLPWTELAPQTFKAMRGVNAALADSTLGARLIDLVQLRVSQMNGCAFCVDMHARDLLTEGEDSQRLHGLAAWREMGFFTDRERAALAWAESLTRVADSHAPDERFNPLKAHFGDQEIVELTIAVAQINLWNRVCVGMRVPVAARPMPVR